MYACRAIFKAMVWKELRRPTEERSHDPLIVNTLKLVQTTYQRSTDTEMLSFVAALKAR